MVGGLLLLFRTCWTLARLAARCARRRRLFLSTHSARVVWGDPGGAAAEDDEEDDDAEEEEEEEEASSSSSCASSPHSSECEAPGRRPLEVRFGAKAS